MSLASRQQIQVLHVDDEPEFTELTGTFLEREDDRFTVETATSADQGLEMIDDRPPDCVVSDYNMPGTDGLEFLQAVRAEYPDLPFILFTGKGSEAVASDAISAGVTDYLQKQSGSEQYELLANRIQNVVTARRDAEEVTRQQDLMRRAEVLGATGGWELRVESEELRLTDGIKQIYDVETDRTLSLEEVLGFDDPDAQQKIRSVIGDAIEDGYAAADELYLQTATGEKRVVEGNAELVESDDDRTVLRGVIHDVTDRQKRQRDLEQIETLFQHAQDSLFLIDVGEEFTVERVNPAWEETIGLSAERVCGQTPRNLFGEQIGAAVESKYDACIQRQKPLQYEETTRLDGEITHWETRIAPVVVDGSVEYIAGSTRDVTEQNERRENLEEYETIIESLTDAVYVIDEEGRFTYVNDEFVELVGYDRETILGSRPSLIKDDDAVEQAEHQLGRLLSSDGPETITFEVTVHPDDGDPVVCEDHMGVLPYDGEEFDGSVGTLRDITDRKERERQLQQERQRYTTLFETLPNPVLHARVKDGEPVVETVNPAFEDTFGYDAETIQTEMLHEYMLPDDQADTAHQLNRQVSTGGDVQTELQRETTEGVRTFRLNVSTRTTETEDPEGYAVYTDITDRKQMERDIKRERDLVTAVVETVPVGISVHDTDGSISLVNEQLESIGGRSLEDLEGNPHDDSRYDLVDRHGEPLGPGETPFDRVVSRGATIHNQVVGTRRPSGERVWLSVSGAPQYNDDGELERTVFAFEDITEQRELEAELSEMLGRISDAFFTLDEEFRVTHLNDRAEELLEVSEDELLGETLWDIYPDTAESDETWDSLRAAMETQDPQSLELCSPGENWYDVRVYPSESGLSVYFQDVTDRKRREQELQRLKRQYETLAENFPDGAVFLIDTDLRCVRAGGEELSNVGLSPDDVEGAKPHALFPEEIADELCHYFERALHGSANTFEQAYEGKRYRIQTVPVRTDDEETDYVMAVSQNITERVEDRQSLEAQNERLEEFASIVSHDLRSPLSVAEGSLELAQETCESDHLVRAADALDRSQALIEDLLALAREGKAAAEIESVELGEVAETSWHNVETGAATLETDAEITIRADRSRLQQLFENLYRNSAEHGSTSSRSEPEEAVEHGGGGVPVYVGAMDDGFYVADTGPGIPESDREEIFEAGYSTTSDGTGFGLRIVKQIADAHGWEITVTDSEQSGARFEFTGIEVAE